jgi:hypothetical protein
MTEIKSSMDIAKEAMEIIKKGAFLTVKAGDAVNTMTIGWATMGHIWRKDVLMVAVRKSRHTFGIYMKHQSPKDLVHHWHHIPCNTIFSKLNCVVFSNEFLCLYLYFQSLAFL